MDRANYERVGQCVFGAHRLEGALTVAQAATAAAPPGMDVALCARVDTLRLSVNGLLAQIETLRHDSADGVASLLEQVRTAHLSMADLLDQLGTEPGTASGLRERAAGM